MDTLVTKIDTCRGPYDGEMRHVRYASLGSSTFGLLGKYLPGDR